MKRHIIYLILLLSFLVSQSVQGGEMTYSDRLVGITLLESLSVTTRAAPTITGNYNDASVKDYIVFGVNHQSDTYLNETYMSVRLTCVIESFDINGQLLSSTNKYLTIAYEPTNPKGYQDKEYFSFEDGYELTCEVIAMEISYTGSIDNPDYQSVTELPENFYLESSITLNRFYDMSSVINTPVSGVENGVETCSMNGESYATDLDIIWNPFTEAEEYQLEYVFVDDHVTSPIVPTYDFEDNSTRIMTSNSEYSIPLVGQKGALLYRIRPVGRDYLNPEIPIFGAWTISEAQGDVSAVVADANGVHKYVMLTTFEEGLNWQMTTTYAEDGKKKEVIGFRDGSQRNRQVVTRTNTDNNAIVGETMYDYTGRAAITVLPAPVNECPTDAFPSLNFRADFNVDENGDSYSSASFDSDGTDACESPVLGMNNTSGASKYYSENNDITQSHQDYIPDAELFPFTQTEYTPDNTGRIRRQGGVGPTHQLDEGHETKYLYGTPSQENLDRLFGSDVGYAVHYKKNLVIDPNGQGSVSYLDLAGKVVATAIVGDGTDYLEDLDSGSGTIDYSAELFKHNSNGVSLSNTLTPGGDGLVFSKEFTVGYQSDYTFDYGIVVEEFVGCDDASGSICFDCVYDFNLEILDNCGNSIAQTSSPLLGEFTVSQGLNVFSITCDGQDFDFDEILTANLGVGQYTVVKTLKISEEAFDFYLATYLDPDYNNCVEPLQTFIDEELSALDFSDCEISCEDCADELGDKDDFIAQGRGSAELFEALYEECMDPCSDNFPVLDGVRIQMLDDVSPGGQYGLFLDEDGNMSISSFPLSVYNSAHQLPITSTDLWKNPKTEAGVDGYFDSDGNAGLVILLGGEALDDPLDITYDAATGHTYTAPENLTDLADFVAAFEDSWAESLLPYHPEYKTYLEYKKYADYLVNGISSDDFDIFLRSITTYQGAIDAGFIDDQGDNTSVSADFSNDEFLIEDIYVYDANNPAVFDPIYDVSYDAWASYNTNKIVGDELQFSLENYVVNDPTVTNSYFNMMEMASIITKCGNGATSFNASTAPAILMDCYTMGELRYPLLTWDDEANVTARDAIWNSFVSYYLGEKGKLIQEQVSDESFEDYRWTPCIGNDDFRDEIRAQYMAYPYTQNASYWGTDQVCGLSTYHLYSEKQKRFQTPMDNPVVAIDEAAYQTYLGTGKCPLDQSLEMFLGELAANYDLTKLNSNVVDVYADYSSFGLLYREIEENNGNSIIVVPGCTGYSDYTLGASSLTYTLAITGVGTYTIALTEPTGASVEWLDITSFYGAHKDGLDNKISVLTLSAGVQESTELNVVFTGNGLHLGGCSFPNVCDLNDVAESVFDIMSLLPNQTSNELGSSSFALSGLNFPANLLIGLPLENTMGITNATGDYSWSYANNVFHLAANNGNEIKLEVTSPTSISPSTVTSVIAFESVSSNRFKITVDVNGTQEIWDGDAYVDNTGSVFESLVLGTCGLPTPAVCRETGHKIREDLIVLLAQELVQTGTYDADIDLYASTQITNNLLNALPLGVTVSSGVLVGNVLTITVGTAMMVLEMDPLSGYEFSDLTGLETIQGVGDLVNNNYYDFEITGVVGSQTVLISGEGFLPLKNCTECDDESYLPSYGANSSDIDSCILVFNTYETYADLFNIWAGTQSNVPTITVLSQNEFVNNYCYCAQNMLDYIDPDGGAAYTEMLPGVGTYVPAMDGDYDWTSPAGGSNYATINDLEVDLSGNVYAIGSFEGVVDFNPGASVYNLTSNGGTDVFIQKLDDNGDFVWAVSFGGTGNDEGSSLAISLANELYSVGHFDGSMDVDPSSGGDVLSSVNGQNVFIQKLDISNTTYTYEWGKTTAAYTASSVVIDETTATGIYVTGTYMGSVNLGVNFSVFPVISEGDEDIYIQKITSSGVVTMVESFGGEDKDKSNDILFDHTRGIGYITGQIVNTATFGTFNGVGSSTGSAFVCVFNSLGQVTHLKTMGVNGSSEGVAIDGGGLSLNPSGGGLYFQPIIVAGNFSGDIELDPGNIQTSQGGVDIFIQLLDAQNNPTWSETIGSVNDEYVHDASNNNTTNLLTGTFSGSLDFNPTGSTSMIQTSTGTQDMFVLAYQTQAPYIWVKTTEMDPGSTAIGNAISGNSDGVYTGGHWTGSGDFDPSTAQDKFGTVGSTDIFVQKLKAATDGGSNVVVQNFPNLLSFCEKSPCFPEIDSVAGFIPLTIDYVNPCITQLENWAAGNAQIRYENYTDSLTTDFSSRYKTHCMGAVETLDETYTDKEHHYTLYYYDQAGNLVRTVPPAGVEVLELTNAEQTQIDADRADDTHLFHTSHRLATTYTYNSLNQLTKQSVPDHDLIKKYEMHNTSGLHDEMTVEAIQFTDNMHGYASGFLRGNNEVGIMYKTSDAGNTWQKVNGLVGADLKAIQMLNASDGFAVGSNGTFLKTLNNGASWEMVDLYTHNITGSFNDVYFVDANNGMLVGDQGLAVKVSGGAYTVATTSASLLERDLTSVDFYADFSAFTYYFTVRVNETATNEAFGEVYTNDYSASVDSWTKLDIEAPETDCMYYCSSTLSTWAGGGNGFLMNSNNNGVLWTRKATDVAGDFKDIYFFDTDNGVAIIDDGSSSWLYATYNGGLNWSVLNATEEYNSITMYEETTTLGKLIAAGDNGALAHVYVSPGTSFGLSAISHPNTQIDFNKAVLATNNGITSISVIASNGNLYFCEDINDDYPSWLTQFIGTGNSLEKLEYKYGGTGNHVFVMLDNLGALFGAIYNPVNTSWSVNTVSSGVVFGEITQRYSGNFLAVPKDINSGDDMLRFSSPIGTISNIVLNSSKDLVNVKRVIEVTGSEFIFASENGYELGSIPDNLCTTIEAGDQIVSLPLNNISASTTNMVFAGENGTVISYDYSSSLQMLTPPTYENLNDVAINGTQIIVCGDHGTLKYGDIGTLPISYTDILHSETEDFNALAVNTSNTLYAVGNNQTLLYAPDYTSSSVINSSIGGNTTGNLNDITFYNGTTAFYAVGDQSALYIGFESFVMQNHLLYTPKLVDHHFYDNQHGYVVGENYTVRYTQDAGYSWSTVLPDGGFTIGSVPELKAVEMLTQTTGITLGNSLYGANLMEENEAIAITQSAISNLEVNDMAFSSATHGLALGSISSTPYSYETDNGGDTWTSVSLGNTNVLNGLYAFSDVESYYGVGDGGVTYFIDLNGTTVSATAHASAGSEHLYAVTFADSSNGYAVGENGMIYHYDNVTYSLSTNNIKNVDYINWNQAFVDEIGEDMGDEYPYGDNSLNTINAIDFVSVGIGVIGGDIQGVEPSPSLPAYLLKCETSKYSGYFFYDRLGRLVASQNARQFEASQKLFSYTLYDELGRISEVGEKEQIGSNRFQDAFGYVENNILYPDVLDDAKFLAFITGAGDRHQVTNTYYDNQVTWMSKTQNNLRHRVATVTTESLWDGDDATYDHGSHYSYDIHGNVAILYQENQKDLQTNQQFKELVYDYDLVSGNVNQVSYQSGEIDAWYHRYAYDADNRITDVETSDNGVIWDLDAKYHYYAHGPLARVELGQNNVQGMDYAYTLQGWLKGVNSNALRPGMDIGNDGSGVFANGLFARDITGFTLGYYEGDYSAIGAGVSGADHFEAETTGSDLLLARSNLYNGNIGHMVTTVVENPGSVDDLIESESYTASPQGMAYTYDQLNRISEALAFDNMDSDFNAWNLGGIAVTDKYKNAFTYDANGNILTQKRNDASGVEFDDLTYHYYKDADGKLLSNRLYKYDDANADDRSLELKYNTDAFINSVGQLNSNNFGYDAIGNLVKDEAEDIAHITWRVDGKIENIRRTGSISTNKNLSFDYDAMGNRIAKHIYEANADLDPLNWSLTKTVYYVRDATGNVMSTYEKNVDYVGEAITYDVIERPIYGSSRVGMYAQEVDMMSTSTATSTGNHSVGARKYELSNHLGNVLSVVTDQILAIDTDNDQTVDYSLPVVTNVSDYYAFGSSMRERSFNLLTGGANLFTPTIEDTIGISVVGDEITNIATTAGHGNSAGVSKEFITGNGSVQASVGTTSDDSYQVWFGLSTVNVDNRNNTLDYAIAFFGGRIGIWHGANSFHVNYSHSYSLGSVLKIERIDGVVNYIIDDVIIESYAETPAIEGLPLLADFSMAYIGTKLHNLKITGAGDAYRYGFNGQEKDDEISGEGNSYNLGLREYDPRLGRMFSIDPRSPEYQWQSPYVYHRNSPIKVIDFKGGGDGDQEGSNTGSTDLKYTGNVILVYTEKMQEKLASQAENVNWDVIYVESLADANEKLEKYLSASQMKGEKLSNLVFRSHGNGKDQGGLMAIVPVVDQYDEGNLNNSNEDGPAPDMLHPNVVFNESTGKGHDMEWYGKGRPQEDYINVAKDLLALGNSVSSGGSVVFTACGAGQALVQGKKEANFIYVISSAASYHNKFVFMNQDNSNKLALIGNPISARMREDNIRINFEYGWLMYYNGNPVPLFTPLNIVLMKGGTIERYEK